MSPKKKNESLTPIIADRLKELLKGKMSQKDLAESIPVSPEHFNRKIKTGFIDSSWMNKICDLLDISSEYLSGKSDIMLTRLAEKRDSISSKDALKNFVISRGFNPSMIDELNELDINEIEYFISYKCQNPHTKIFDFQKSIKEFMLLND